MDEIFCKLLVNNDNHHGDKEYQSSSLVVVQKFHLVVYLYDHNKQITLKQ